MPTNNLINKTLTIKDPNMTISKPLLYSIALALKQKTALKDIAENLDVSNKTVNRELKKYSMSIKMNFSPLPEMIQFYKKITPPTSVDKDLKKALSILYDKAF